MRSSILFGSTRVSSFKSFCRAMMSLMPSGAASTGACTGSIGATSTFRGTARFRASGCVKSTSPVSGLSRRKRYSLLSACTVIA
ncbi:hypothetical protein D3C72_1714050 [compost metagenome]